MKKFNLEAALAGEPVVTREGTKVKVIYVGNRKAKYPVLAIHPTSDGIHEAVNWVRLDGKNYEKGNESSCDLFMASQKRTYWMNIYNSPSEGIRSGLSTFDSKETAMLFINPSPLGSYISTISFELEE